MIYDMKGMFDICSVQSTRNQDLSWTQSTRLRLLAATASVSSGTGRACFTTENSVKAISTSPVVWVGRGSTTGMTTRYTWRTNTRWWMRWRESWKHYAVSKVCATWCWWLWFRLVWLKFQKEEEEKKKRKFRNEFVQRETESSRILFLHPMDVAKSQLSSVIICTYCQQALFSLPFLVLKSMDICNQSCFLPFLIQMSVIWICVISWVCPAGWPVILHSKNLSWVLLKFFYACHIYSHLFNFVPLSVALDLSEVHKVGGQRSQLGSFSCALLSWLLLVCASAILWERWNRRKWFGNVQPVNKTRHRHITST